MAGEGKFDALSAGFALARGQRHKERAFVRATAFLIIIDESHVARTKHCFSMRCPRELDYAACQPKNYFNISWIAAPKKRLAMTGVGRYFAKPEDLPLIK